MTPPDFRPLDRTENGMTYGVLVPHFGADASPKRIIEGAVLAEDIGLDAVWVRDHLLWTPHGMEGTDPTFVEPLTALAAIASRTSKVYLGTAVLIPLRWPLKLAQDLASLSYLAGGRVIAGLGLGSGEKELGAAGFKRSDRKKIFVETAEIIREVWYQDRMSYSGEMFQYEDVGIFPKPVDPIPIWYGGTTTISVKNAVQYCDAWMPGRIPLATLDDRLATLSQLEQESGRKITRSIIPLVKVDKDRDRARADLPIEALAGSSEASKTWIMPEGGFKELDDLRGIVAAGTPEEIIDQVVEIASRGIDHFVFDLRMQHDRFEETLELIGNEVLPALKAAKV